MELRTPIDDTIAAETSSYASNVAALHAIVGFLTTRLRRVAKPLLVGESGWPDDAHLTYDGEGVTLFLDTRVENTTNDRGCGTTSGFMLALRETGLYGGVTRGQYWSARGGGELWSAELLPVTVEEVAGRVRACDVVRYLKDMFEQRQQAAQAEADNNAALADALRMCMEN